MEMSPDSSPAKRTRARPKVASKTPVEAKPAAAKKPRAPRKSPTTDTTQAEMPMVAVPVEAMPEDVGSMVATAAYYLAAARNFAPGYELDDWLEAERKVHAKLYG